MEVSVIVLYIFGLCKNFVINVVAEIIILLYLSFQDFWFSAYNVYQLLFLRHPYGTIRYLP